MENIELVSMQRLEDGNTLRMFLGTNESESGLMVAFALDDYKFEVPMEIWNAICWDYSNALLKHMQGVHHEPGNELLDMATNMFLDVKKSVEEFKEKCDDKEREERKS